MNRVFVRLGLVGAMLVAGTSALVAQDSTTGALSGIVTDASGAILVGARVSIDGGRGTLSFVTDAKGSFKAVGLIPGQYTITVSMAGFETSGRRVAGVSINTLTPVRITLAKTAGAVVEVFASTTSIDTTTQTSGSTFTSSSISSLPLGRSFASVVNLAPGVAGSGIDSNNPAIGGASGLDNAFVIDGVNTTATGYGANGSYSIVYGSLGTGINTDFISEVQVKSFGLDAEFGGAAGGMVNAVTKTGDNTFTGQVFAYFDIESLQGKQKLPNWRPGTTIRPPSWDGNSRTELGFTAAGPLIKDHLFYFVGYNPIRTSVKRTQVDPGQQFLGRQVERKSEVNSYYGKLNWIITPSQNLEVSIFGDPGKLPLSANLDNMVYSPTYTWEEVEYGGTNWSVKYNGVFFNNLMVEAQASQATTKFKRKLDPEVQNRFRVTDAYSGTAYSGGPGFVDGTDDKNQQYNLKITKTFGDFEAKVGYAKENLEHKGGNTYQGPAGFIDPHTGATGQPYTSGALVQVRYFVDPAKSGGATITPGMTVPGTWISPYYRITRARTSPPLIPTKAPYENFFIQGKYNWNNRLFLKAGLRWDQENMHGKDNDYKFKASDAMAPRVSITLDPNADGKNKIYVFYGKYYSKVPLDLAVRSLSNEIGVSRSDFYNLNSSYNQLSNPIQTGTTIWDVNNLTNKVGTASTTNHFIGSAGFLTPVLPGTKLPFINEFVLGWDSQPSAGLTLSNRFIYRNLGRVLEDMGIDGGNALPYYIGNPGQNSWQLADEARKIDPTLLGTYTATWPDPVRNYYAWEFEVTKTGQNWSGFLNLRLSRLEGNYEGNYNGMNGQSDPNITSLYDMTVEYLSGPNDDGTGEDALNRGIQGNQVYAVGPLSNDRAIILNAGGTYNWDNGWSVSGVMKFQTGTPLSKLYGYGAYDNAGEIPSGGRGAIGRTPNTTTFDLSSQYIWKLAGKHKVIFRADVFNLFNASKPVTFDQNYENSVGVDNTNYANVASYQTSRRVRLGVKYLF